MSTEDADWDAMLQIAKFQQQEFYEYFPSWTKYNRNEYKYLKQNIGFAIFGPPSDETVKATDIQDITESICYLPDVNKMIENVYKKIYEFGEGCIQPNTIYYALIYNITFRTKRNQKAFKSKEEEKINLSSTPVFKIHRGQHKIWYIDIFGRVYESWDDYKKNNTLPKCTMVLPKDGFYQPDQSKEITKDASVVLLEILDSPACNIVRDTLNAISNVTGVLGIGLTAASLFTPAAPIAVAAFGANSVCGLSTVWRSAQNLKDKWSHKESISLTNGNAFCAWLSISGCVTGLMATGGYTVLNKWIRDGTKIGNAAKFSYNTVLLSNIGVSTVNLGYHGYCTYEKYQSGKSLSVLDIASLTCHILFYSQTVLSAKLAEELIKTTQTKIIDDYRVGLRSKNLRKKFNRMKRKAATNNDDMLNEQAEVIRYINRKKDFKLNNNLNHISTQKRSMLTFEDGKIVICEISLIDPFELLIILIELDKNLEKQDSNETTFLSSQKDNDYMVLENLLLDLLQNAFSDDNNTIKYDFESTKFEAILHDIKYGKNAPDLLKVLFNIALQLVTSSNPCDTLVSIYLPLAIKFIWYYVKESVKQDCLKRIAMKDEAIQKLLSTIIITLFENVDEIVVKLLPAFKKYISYNKII